LQNTPPRANLNGGLCFGKDVANLRVMKRERIYTDTSVIGGYFDAVFEEDSRRFIEGVRVGKIRLLLSEVVVQEISKAPARVQELLASLPPANIEKVEIDAEIIALREAYLAAKIVGAKWTDDATHVAAATVARADAIVSWNFAHIVRLDKMKAYNQINLLNGYGILTIITPKEVRYDE
jgi:predicted nucleic acid-binding protein